MTNIFFFRQIEVERGTHKLVISLIDDHHIHPPYKKRIIERTIQYLKNRTEMFDDYFLCRKYSCKLEYTNNC
jgi:hypothetical protein